MISIFFVTDTKFPLLLFDEPNFYIDINGVGCSHTWLDGVLDSHKFWLQYEVK